MKSKISNLLVVFLMYPVLNVSAAFYTVDQSISIPGMPDCQLILISIWDDMNTSERSDDRHMRTDAFLRCGNEMNRIPNAGNFESTSKITQYSSASLLSELHSFLLSLLDGILTEDDRAFLHYLILKIREYQVAAEHQSEGAIFIDLMAGLPEKFSDRMDYNVGFTSFQEPIQRVEDLEDYNH